MYRQMKLTYGMVGGGPGAFIGDPHRRSIALDGEAKLVAGCFSNDGEKTATMADILDIEVSRCYAGFEGDFNRVTVKEVEKLAGGDGSGRVQR